MLRTTQSLSGWAALAALVACSTALRWWGARSIPGLWIAPDEMVYGILGQNLYRHGSLTILGGPTGFYSLVYPGLAGIPLSFGDLRLGYDVLKGLQAFVMSLAAVPVYFWGRSLVRPRLALTAAVLSVAIPGLVYSGLVMTEVAFYPVVALAGWAMTEALTRPTLARQLLLLGAIALAAATRVQGIVLVPVLVTALSLKLVLDRERPLLRPYWPTALGLCSLAGAWIAWRAAAGGPGNLLGAYAEASGSYDAGDAARYVAYHAADAVLLVGIVPACALGVLLLEALSGREGSARSRAFLAVAVSLFAWLVVEVGVFASRHVERLAERDLLGLAPPLFVALALWLERGAPRPFIRSALVAIVVLAPVVSLPVKSFVTKGGLPDAFTLVPLYEHVQRADRATALLLAAGILAGAFLLVPRRAAWLLPLALVGVFAAVSVSANRAVAAASRYDQTQLLGGAHTWIDGKADAGVAYLYDSEWYWNGVWQETFWNRRIDSVYFLGRTAVPGPLPQTRARVTPHGEILPASNTRYVVASTRHAFVGTPVARIEQPGTDQIGLVLWRVQPPLRLASILRGVRANGDMHNPGVLRAFDCAHGELRLVLLRKQGPHVQIFRNGKLYETVTIPEIGYWSGTVPPPPDAAKRGVCDFVVRGEGLLGSTRFEWVRTS